MKFKIYHALPSCLISVNAHEYKTHKKKVVIFWLSSQILEYTLLPKSFLKIRKNQLISNEQGISGRNHFVMD